MPTTNIILYNTEEVLVHTPTDAVFFSAAKKTFREEVNHILCCWHVDWYAHDNGLLYVHACVYSIRTWKQQLWSAGSESQLDLDQMLFLLESETDTAMFNERMKKFLNFWKGKETSFVNYFEQHHRNRPGVPFLSVYNHI